MLSVKVGEITQCLGKERAVIWLPLLLHKFTLSREKGRGYIKGKEEGVRGEEKGEGKTVMNMNEEKRKKKEERTKREEEGGGGRGGVK